MKELVARTLKVSMIVAFLFVFGQLSAQAMPVADDKSALDESGFFPGGWDRNDLRSDAAEPAEKRDHNDLRAH